MKRYIIQKRPFFMLVVASLLWTQNGQAFRNIHIGSQLPNPELQTLDDKTALILDAKAKVNLFLFFRPNQPHSIAALNVLTKICPAYQKRGISCSAIVSDYYTKQQVRKVIHDVGWKEAKTLIDKDDFYYGTLGASLHPSFGIADNEFTLLAYEPFTETNYYNRIEAQVRFAFGDINNKQLQRLLNPPILDDDEDKNRARLDLNFAKMLFESGKLDNALRQARKAAETDQELADAHALIGLIYAKKKMCRTATSFLEKALSIDKNNTFAKQGKQLCK